MDRLPLSGFALIMGGAAGNVFDRIVWGRVTDFLVFYIGHYQWPTFNVADSAIVVGSGLLLLDHAEAEADQAAQPDAPEIVSHLVSPHLRRAGGRGVSGGAVVGRQAGAPGAA